MLEGLNKATKNTEKELQKLINEAYLYGYEQGYESGKLNALLEKNTPNQIRKMLGLEQIKTNDI